MIRTIHEHWLAAKRLRKRAPFLPPDERERCLQMARPNLRLAEAQLRDPKLSRSRRPLGRPRER